MDALTTLAVRKSTLKRLKNLQEYRRESYDETINKIITVASMARCDTDGELAPETKAEIEQGRREISEGKGMSTKELMKKLGIE